MVNMLKPVACQTFKEYAERVFLKYLAKQLEAIDRLDIVWVSTYKTLSKAQFGASVEKDQGDVFSLLPKCQPTGKNSCS